MYIKLKEELRTIEFINKYFSKIYITKPEEVENYESNHFMLNMRPIVKDKNSLWEDVVHLQDGKLLNEIFLNKENQNYKLIIHSLTCSNANVSNVDNNIFRENTTMKYTNFLVMQSSLSSCGLKLFYSIKTRPKTAWI